MTATFLLAATLLLQQPATNAPDSPIGNWIATHSSDPEAPALWWSFHPDGSVTATAGFLVHSRWKLNGDTLTIDRLSAETEATTYTIRIEGNTLYRTSTSALARTAVLTRLTPPTNSALPLIGAWRIASDPRNSPEIEQSIHRGTLNFDFVYNADGTLEARIPVQTTTGHWSPTTHTYTVPDHPALPFHRTGPNLTLTPPTDPKPHLYHPDTFPTP